MFNTPPSPSAIAHIDTQALLSNFRLLKQKRKNFKSSIAMIKANAYGHGLIPIGKLLEQEADYLGVASIFEGIELRAAGIQTKILIFSGFFDQSHVEPLIAHDLIPVIHSDYQINLLSSYFIAENIKKEIWLKINTGMNRLGFSPNDFETAYNHLKQQYPTASFNVLTHLAEAESENFDFTKQQTSKFEKLIQDKVFDHISISNSAAILNHHFAACNTFRAGISMYGISTLNNPDKNLPLKPVMTLQSHIIALHDLSVGESIGYDCRFRAKKPIKIAVVSIGYGDGYPQYTPDNTTVLINGKARPIVGKVSMDMITVDVTHLKSVKILDEVILWGEKLPVENIANEINASPYALVTGVTQRVPRKYI